MTRGKVALAMAAACASGVLMAGCGGSGGTTTPPPTNYTLTIDSTSPTSGVQVGVTENGSTLSAGVTTPGSVTAASGTTFVVTAPSTAPNGNVFSSWTGCASTSGTGNVDCNLTLSGNTTVTANYAAPTTYTLTVDSTGTGVSVTDSPADNNGTTSGTTPFTLTYNAGTTVTLVAPLPPGFAFSSWTGCTSATGNSCTVTMNANTTVTANYTAQGAQYTLTVDSVNPSSGVGISITYPPALMGPAGTTPFTSTQAAGTQLSLSAPLTASGNNFTSWTGCTSMGSSANICNVTLSANMTVTVNYAATPTVTVTPASASINTEQSLEVTVAVAGPAGDPTPSGTVTLSNGSGYTSTGATLQSGSAMITIPAGSLAVGVNTLTATYTPDTPGAVYYTPATGTHGVTVATITPTVTVTPTSTTIDNQQSDNVTVTVSAPSGDPTPTGSVTLTGDGYDGTSTTLTSGSATFTIPAGTLSSGSDTLGADYTPDATSANIYGTATGTSPTITVTAVTTVTVDQSSVGPATTNQILGVNLEAWYDVVGNASTVNTALGPVGSNDSGGAGMAAVRWPGGSWSDGYHWGYQTGSSSLVTPYQCTCSSTTSCTANSEAWAGYSTFAQFESAIPEGGSFDLALTADYGTNEACTGGGDPNEAAAWAAAAVTDGHAASHMTVGNEEYGSWETDLHANAHDPTTYADAVIGTTGYYALIKAASPTTLVGVVTDADGSSSGWDSTVMADAKGSYDFVEYHYYPQYGNVSSDYDLVYVYGPQFTQNINTLKQELTTYGTANTPIYAGEVGGNSGNPGTQSWSITQGLFAGQILGEAMNDGVSRLTWWDSFDNCFGAGNNEAGQYGWQNTWGAESIFSAGPTIDSACPGDGAAGTLSPTARAFQLFSYVAVNGENVLGATVSGDTTDVRAYSATHSGGTALVLFNLNATTAEPVEITLSTTSSTTDMQVITYDKEIYDYTNVNCQADSVSTFTPYPCTYDSTHDYSTAVWAAPTTTDLGAQNLPTTLVLQPWSMNVVIIK